MEKMQLNNKERVKIGALLKEIATITEHSLEDAHFPLWSGGS